jgi:hypothetical protein
MTMCQSETVTTTGFRQLDPAHMAISRDAFNQLRLSFTDGTTIDSVKPVRAFPLTSPQSCVFMQNAEGEEIGLIADVSALADDSRQVLEEELRLEYFTTPIESIRSVKSRHGVTSWEVETERGRRTIHVKDRTDIRKLPGRRIIFTDVEGMKFEVRDADDLSDRSQAFLDAET